MPVPVAGAQQGWSTGRLAVLDHSFCRYLHYLPPVHFVPVVRHYRSMLNAVSQVGSRQLPVRSGTGGPPARMSYGMATPNLSVLNEMRKLASHVPT
jgi:hypothetical protein